MDKLVRVTEPELRTLRWLKKQLAREYPPNLTQLKVRGSQLVAGDSFRICRTPLPAALADCLSQSPNSEIELLTPLSSAVGISEEPGKPGKEIDLVLEADQLVGMIAVNPKWLIELLEGFQESVCLYIYRRFRDKVRPYEAGVLALTQGDPAQPEGRVALLMGKHNEALQRQTIRLVARANGSQTSESEVTNPSSS